MNRSVSICAMAWLILVTAAHSMEFGADGRRLDPPEDRQRQYQWKDPVTGKAITKPYPPANLQMRQAGKSDDGMTVYLEVIGETRFADVPAQKAPDATKEIAKEEKLIATCLSAACRSSGYKDPDSLKVEGSPLFGVETYTGEVRRSVQVDVNAKNSYGAYAGAKSVTCIFGSDNQTVIEILN